jgi:endothelin-converting enzyme/putative endopeptidase
MRLPLILTASLLALAACKPADPAPQATATAAASTHAALGEFGIDTSAMDTNVKPGDDFYKYVNGTWLATYQLPPDKARYGVFDQLRDKSEDDVRTILESLPADAAAGSIQQKVRDFYGSWMDTAALETRGVAPLQPDLQRIAAATTANDIQKLMGEPDFSAPFGVFIEPDSADPTKYTVYVTQSGLGMPNRDYYLTTGERFDAYRAAYKTYVTTIFQLIGDANPAASADAVIALERRIAQAHWTPAQQRNVQATNNPVDRAGLARMVPGVNWDVVLTSANLASQPRFIVQEKTAIQQGAALINSTPVATWQKYLAFHLASDYAAYLPAAFDTASFNFYGKTIRGVEQQRDRWRRGVQLLDGSIGEGVGEIYVQRFFPPRNKELMDQLVTNLRTAMGQRLTTLAWMDDATRAEAQKKLSTFDPRVGYPATFRDYSALTIEPGKLFENVRAARRFEWNRQVGRLNGTVDRTEWAMNPQTVNAYYNPLMNQITFPAAILQPPFFDPNADPAVNYGAIGAVIGHEMGHGFDDQGREFDETGKIRNWWTPATNTKFQEQTTRFAAQYNAFCPIQGLCVNGSLTMGENIGDLGGLEMAYTAYRLSLNGQEAPVLGGFTGDQRFFMAHAQVWRAMQREDALRNQILTDPHSPAAARGSLPERNIDAWYAAFNVQPGDRLYIAPEQRVHIW